MRPGPPFEFLPSGERRVALRPPVDHLCLRDTLHAMSDEQDKLKLSLEPPKLFGRKKKAAEPAQAPAPVAEERAARPVVEPEPEEIAEPEPTAVLPELVEPEPEPVVIEEPEVTGVELMEPDSVTIRVMVKTAPLEQWGVARALRQRIKARFDHEGIKVPFAQRVVWHREDRDQHDQHAQHAQQGRQGGQQDGAARRDRTADEG